MHIAFAGKKVLVTGAAHGFGRAISAAFAARGAEVWAVDVLADEVQQTAADINAAGGNCHARQLDITDADACYAMVQEASAGGMVDVLVNNAGVAQQKLLLDLTGEEWDRMFAVNVKGIFHCCQGVLPRMIQSKRGKIINISSIWGLTGASCEVHYSAAKAAVIGFTKALAKEVGPSNIQVNCVAPGVIQTEMNAHLDTATIEELKNDTPLGVLGAPRDVAELVLFLASDKADFITGQVISPNGGFLI